ncbi:MAG: hypothetical protein K2M95_00430 [Clostridiales bacterium]|nr:hypothetical protein [Clostridiales bacterium]
MNKELDELLGNATVVQNGAEGHRARVRESMHRNPELKGLADYELLEYLLFATISRKDTKPIAKDLIRKFGSLSAVLHADYEELLHVDGIGEKTAHLLAYVLPIVMQAESERYGTDLQLDTPKRTAQYMHTRFLGQRKEQLLMASLTLNNSVIQVNEVASGTVDAANVDVMKILRIADRNGAKKIVLAHNHPGGTMHFSTSDIELTSQVVTACFITGIYFIDHLIFYGKRYYSMFGNREMPNMLEACMKYTGALTEEVSRERSTYENLSRYLRESNEGRSPRRLYEMLAAYRALFALDDAVRNEILSGLSSEVDDDLPN